MANQGSMLSKTLVIGIILLLVVAVSPISVSNIMLSPIVGSSILPLDRSDCQINITVHEAWNLLTNTSNGIQIPIDIRSREQWNEGFVDTPWPEHPRWHGNGTGEQEFIDMYDGEDIIIYCTGGYHSLLLCYILCDAGFNGTVYNMIEGITAWIEEGYPIRNNTPPEAPYIIGQHSRGRPIKGPTKNYNFTTIDPDGDKIYLYIDWGDGTYGEEVGPYDSGEEVTITHTFYQMGNYLVEAYAKDIFGAKGPWGTEMIPILRSRQMINSCFQLLFNRFPLLEVFLREMNLLR